MTFSGAADGRVAWHESHGVWRQRAQPHGAAKLGGSPRGFNARMSRAHDNDIEISHRLFFIDINT
jgi:hypothetical protein